MRYVFWLAIMLCATVTEARATAQIPDIIIYQGKSYGLHSNPLDYYFARYPHKHPSTLRASSANWRGYVATFEVKNKTLVLKEVEYEGVVRQKRPTNFWGHHTFSIRRDFDKAGWYPAAKYATKSAMPDIVPTGDTLVLDWFTGILVMPHGELLHYVHMGYGSTYSNYILLEVHKGIVTGERRLSGRQYTEFKQRQFQAFKKTSEYKNLFNHLKKRAPSAEKETPEEIDGFIRSYIIRYTSKFLDEDE